MQFDFSAMDERLYASLKKYGYGRWDKLIESIRDIEFPYLNYFFSYMRDIDPFSDEYIIKMKDIHGELIKSKDRQTYSYLDEGAEVDIEKVVREGYPWCCSNDKASAIRKLKVQMDILSALQMYPHVKKILEPGCGLGGLTEFLVKLDYCVHAVDCNSAQCTVVQRRLKSFQSRFVVTCDNIQDFLKKDTEKYDAIIFMESFHHLLDHYSILSDMVSNRLNDKGIVILANEPIGRDDRYEKIVPYPWGVRLDPESLFRMRIQGWLELGFKKSYIRSMCNKLNLYILPIPGALGHELYVLSKEPFEGGEYQEYDESVRAYVVNCYKYILGRNPESETVVGNHCFWYKQKNASFEDMRDRFVMTKEFGDYYTQLLNHRKL